MSQVNVQRDPRSGRPGESTAALDHVSDSDQEIEGLRTENAALRAKIDELEQLVCLGSQEADERWAERQREYEGLLEEKSEVIRALHQKVGELRERAIAAAPANGGNSQAATPDRQELLDLQRQLEEERLRMQEDEEAMMSQLRQMEMGLARDRAELARQRSEVQRLHGEIKHDMDMAARDGGLRERLGALQRRPAAAAPAAARPTVSQDTPTPGASKSGLLRRLFGSGK